MSAIAPPYTFAEGFYQECVGGSGISPDLYADAVRIVEDSGYWEPNRALNHRVSQFWQTRRPHSFGAIAGFYQETGELWQAKAKHPRLDQDGDPIKYEYPLGAPLRAYLPSVNRATRRAIASRYGLKMPEVGRFWDWVEQHPEIEIVVTEGAKKALALLSLGYVAIALVGVNGGVLKWEKIGGVKLRRLQPELIPDLARFAVEDRQITLAFDQDAKATTRNGVERALADLSFHLEWKGATVKITSWNGEDGRCKGVDDLIVNAGSQAWDEAYQTSTLAPVWRIRRELSRRVKRKPDLPLGDAEFKAAVGRVPSSGILAMLGGKGSGKSTLIKATLEASAQPWLSFTFLQSLARDQAAGWGGAFINDGDRHQGTLLNRQGEPVLGGSVCWPSALSVSQVEAKIVVLDELVPSLRFLHGSSLANQNGIRPLLEAELVRRIQQAELVILADADLTEEAIAYIEAIRGERAFLVRSNRKPLTWPCVLLNGTRNQATADFHEAALGGPDGKILMLHSDSRALVESLSERLEGQGIKTLPITQKTSGGEIEREFLESKGGTLPELVAMGIKVILCSPSVTQGFSIEKNTYLIHEVWGIFTGGSIDAESIAQSLDRVRSLAERKVWLPMKGRATSKLSTATDGKAVLKDLETSSKASLRLARLSLRPEAMAMAEGIDYQRENLKLLAEFEARRNRGALQLRHTVWALLEHEGKRVTVAPCQSSIDAAKGLATILQETKRKQEIERAARIEAHIPLTQREVDEIEKRLKKKPESVTEQELEALEQFYLRQFYRVEKVDQALVLWDKGGKRRQSIRNLEYVLNPDAATARTVASIDRNSTNPQDWDKAALHCWLLEKTGAADFIRAICDCSITELPPETVEEVAAQLQQHPKEFEIAFQVKNIHEMHTTQVITWLLQRHGISWETARRRQGQKVLRVRVIDQSNLAELKAVIERRSQADPPPQESNQTQGGGSQENPQDTEVLEDLRRMWEEASSYQEREAVLGVAEEMGLPPSPSLWRQIA